MRTQLWALVVCAATGGIAFAQPTQPAPQPPTGPQPQPAPGDPPVAPVAPQPPPPEPQPQPQPPPPAPEPAPAPADTDMRPNALSVAIGLGYLLPTSLETPNVTTVRLRLPSGLTFEPQLIFQKTTHTVDTGAAQSDDINEVGLGALVRYPLVMHGHIDLEIVGAFNVDQLSVKPDTPDTDDTKTRTQLDYGVAVTAWITKHWQVSLTALNPLLSIDKDKQEMGPGTVTVTTDTTYGLVFDPTVLLMVHLYH